MSTSTGVVQGEIDKTRGDIAAKTSEATGKVSELTGYMNSLISAATFAPPYIRGIAGVRLGLSPGVISAPRPGRPDLSALRQRTSEEPPTDFTPSIASVSFPSVPDFNAALAQPVIPDAPTFVIQTPADKPDIADPRALPANITDDRPTTFTVGNYNVPSPIAITIPDFTENIPANTLVPPTQQFDYVEPTFALTLKDDITTKLNDDINNGGTGLDSDIEDAIFDRTEERDKLEMEDEIQAVKNEWSGSGFSLPNGVLQGLVEKVRLKYSNNRLTTNRDIQKLQADLAQANTHFTIDKGLNLVAQELQYAHQLNERALRSEQLLIEFTISLWETKVSDHNLKLERVRLQAIKNASIFEGEGLRLEAYKNELLELEAKSSLDKDKIDNYTAQVNSFNAKIGLFKEQVNAVSVSTGVEDLKIRFYEGQTADYVSRVNAENTKFLSHSATVEGELGKVKVYESQVSAYVAQVTGVGISTEAQMAILDKNIKSEDLRLRGFTANIDKWRSKVALAEAELGFEANMYGKDIDVYVADIQKATAQIQTNLKTSEVGQRLAIENLKIAAANIQANLQASISAAQVRVAAAEGAATAYGALVAALAGTVQSILTVEGKATLIDEHSS